MTYGPCNELPRRQELCVIQNGYYVQHFVTSIKTRMMMVWFYYILSLIFRLQCGRHSCAWNVDLFINGMVFYSYNQIYHIWSYLWFFSKTWSFLPTWMYSEFWNLKKNIKSANSNKTFTIIFKSYTTISCSDNKINI